MLHLSMWVVAATLCQAPADAGWLDAVPPEADVVFRVRGMESTRDDLVAMLKAMSPALANTAEPFLDQRFARFKAEFGEHAVTDPFLTLIRAVRPGDQTQPPFAVVVKSDRYEAVIKSVAGGNDANIKHDNKDYDTVITADGKTWYAAKGDGTVAFGPDKMLIAAYAKPGDKTLGKTLSPSLRKQLFHGDVGVYVNLNALATRYAAEIQQGRDAFMAALDAAPQQAGNAGMMESVKKMYVGLFDSLKVADSLALNFDFAATGLNLGGELSVKADSGAARSIAAAKTGDAGELAKLSADAAYSVYMNIDSKSFDQLQSMGLNMMFPGGKKTPELEAALERIRGMGRIETVTGMTISNGMKTFSVTNVSDPKKFLAASEAILKAMRGTESPLNYFKDLRVTPAVETYKGYTFDRVDMTLDYDKLAKSQPSNTNTAAGMKALFGGDRMTTWYGASESRLIQVTAPTWDEAKAKIDSFSNGRNGLGTTPEYQALRDQLPKQASILFLVNAQGLVRQFATQFAAMFANPNMKAPDLPREPAFIGVSLTPQPPTGYEFHLVVPSPVGPVIEKGLVPLFQQIATQAAQPKP